MSSVKEIKQENMIKSEQWEDWVGEGHFKFKLQL